MKRLVSSLFGTDKELELLRLCDLNLDDPTVTLRLLKR